MTVDADAVETAGERFWPTWVFRLLAGRASLGVSAVLLSWSLVLAGCASTTPVQQMYQSLVASMRTPGEKMVRSLEDTRKEYACVAHRKAVLKIEEVQVLPDVVSGGREINQRLHYAFCPSTPAEPLRGSITRTIQFNGKVIFSDIANHEFKPGTWVVDAFIGIPGQAQSGVYGVDVVLRWKNRRLVGSNSFVVKGI